MQKHHLVYSFVSSFRQTNNTLMKSNAAIYARTGLVERLRFLMEKELLYRNPSLDLPKLSNRLGTSKGKTSKLINGHFGKSFTIYLNDYRLKEVLQKLQMEDSRSLTITGIAMEAGFSSRSSFYRHFKYRTNNSPSAFLKKEQSKRVHFSIK